jgi:hypothetical protein
VTVAENVSDPPAVVVAVLGEIATAIEVTVTAALPDFVGSATLVATTWYVPAAAGATYVPPASMIPPPLSCTDQLTRVSVVLVTLALKICVPPAGTVAVAGETETTIGGGTATVTVTDLVTLRPAPSLTVSVYVVVAAGVTLTLPPLAIGPTPWSMAPAPPLYVAESVALPPAVMLEGVADKLWTAGGDGVTVTVALPDFVGSATLVATTWYVPAAPGAV